MQYTFQEIRQDSAPIFREIAQLEEEHQHPDYWVAITWNWKHKRVTPIVFGSRTTDYIAPDGCQYWLPSDLREWLAS